MHSHVQLVSDCSLHPPLLSKPIGLAGRPTGMKAASYATKLNANAGSAKRSQAQSAATFTAALEYRRQQQALAETAAVSVAAAEAAAALEAAAEAALAEAAGETASQLGDDTVVVSVSPNILTEEGLEQNTYTQTRAEHASAAQNGSSLSPAAQKGSQHAQHVVQNVDQHADDAQRSLAMPQQNGTSRAAVFRNGSPSINGNGAAAIRTGHASGNGRPSLIGSQARPDGAGAPPQQGKSDTCAANEAEASGAVAASQQVPLVNSSIGNSSQARESLLHQSGLSQGAAEAETVPVGTAQTGATSSPSSVADDAMAAAIASIQSEKVKSIPKVPTGAKAIPTPSPNTSPRIKSALLAAQEYRKLKAAKTAALAVAAATAADAAAKSKSQNHFGNQ